MEIIVRKPFQGVLNIVRFNWHFYVLAVLAASLLFIFSIWVPQAFRWIVNNTAIFICTIPLFSLVISCYIYDLSGFYKLEWLQKGSISANASKIININAGFDETTALLKAKYPSVPIEVFDFYDPKKHTEVSIKRARKLYGTHPGTQRIDTRHIPVDKNSSDLIFNIFSIHEIRNEKERVDFLRKQNEILRGDGQCIVVEHLRDLPNFIAYNVGFLHFFSFNEWSKNFFSAGFKIEKIIKLTPFVSLFVLTKKNGITP